MQKRIFLLFVFSIFIIALSCSSDPLEIRYAPRLFDVSAPDSLEKGSIDTSYVFVSVFDLNGQADVDSVYFISTRPDGTSNGFHLYMHDDGRYGDSTAADGRFTLGILAPQPTSQSGDYTFTFYALDKQGDKSNNPTAIITAY